MDQWNDSFVTTKAEVGRILTLGTCLHQFCFTALVSSATKNININHKGSSPTMNTLRESSEIPQHYPNHGPFMVSIGKTFFKSCTSWAWQFIPLFLKGFYYSPRLCRISEPSTVWHVHLHWRSLFLWCHWWCSFGGSRWHSLGHEHR